MKKTELIWSNRNNSHFARLDFFVLRMYTQTGDVMFQKIENLHLLSVVRITTLAHTFHVSNRPTHLLLLKIRGESSFRFEYRTLHFQGGDLVFVPKGATYFGSADSPTGEALVIEFEADIADAVPQVHSLKGYPNLNYLYEHMEQMWLFNSRADRFQCYSIFYQLLSFVSTKIDAQYAFRTKLHLIAPATEHLQSHIFDCDLTVDRLYSLCGISDTYFRKIFKANYGVSPQQYIINARMAKALNCISSRQYRSISDVALSVGYKDTLYFSRLFSKIHGVSPSRYLAES